MKEVTVVKVDLVERIKSNRDDHRSLFEKALQGYFATARKALEEMFDRIQAAEQVSIQLYMPVPEDHTRDYDQVLEMLAMEVRDQVTIDYKSFRQYVLDDWDWKQQWVGSNSTYLSQEG